jgi:hypothetical protein
MNPFHISTENEMNALHLSATSDEKEMLVQHGFSSEEGIALLWLRQWYQSGGSDRAPIVRRLGFLKHLITTNQIEL